MTRAIRQYLARRRLQRIVDAQARSREVIDYRIRRAAGKLGWVRRMGRA